MKGEINLKNQSNFNTYVRSLLNHEVEIVTTQGTYIGTLVQVDADTVYLQTRMRGQSVRIAIRTAFIVTIFPVIQEQRAPFWMGFPNEQHNVRDESV
jgi:small nuclear ribonucleoprotein (snRNP)-like protein